MCATDDLRFPACPWAMSSTCAPSCSWQHRRRAATTSPLSTAARRCARARHARASWMKPLQRQTAQRCSPPFRYNCRVRISSRATCCTTWCGRRLCATRSVRRMSCSAVGDGSSDVTCAFTAVWRRFSRCRVWRCFVVSWAVFLLGARRSLRARCGCSRPSVSRSTAGGPHHQRIQLAARRTQQGGPVRRRART